MRIMTRSFTTSTIGALAATLAVAWAGGAWAQSSAATSIAAGTGYTASDAPLGAPTELKIELRGQVAPRCELATPPAGLGALSLGRAGEHRADFRIDCNTPFVMRVVSRHGGFANGDATPGIAAIMPYAVAVDVGTDSGREDLGWCEASELKGGGASCPFASGSADRGWSSGQAIAIDQPGRLRLRWPDQKTLPEPVLGAYGDTITIELEVRS